MEKVESAYSTLRSTMVNAIATIEVWSTLEEVCKALNISLIETEDRYGKAKYLEKVFSLASNEAVYAAGQIFITNYPGTRQKPSFEHIQKIQDALWWIDSRGIQKISNVTRISIVESLQGERFTGRLSLKDFISEVVFIPSNFSSIEIGTDGYLYQDQSFNELLNDLFLFSPRSSSEKPNWVRISTLDFFIQLGLKVWPDQRFCLLLEELVNPEVNNREMQNKLVLNCNRILLSTDFELKQQDARDGFPIYRVLPRNRGVLGNAKYIIFASRGPKPDIVISDAVNMDIKIVSHAEQCIVYDEPSSSGELTWETLVGWWYKSRKFDTSLSDARKSLGKRLIESLQSEPERIMFSAYFHTLKPIYRDKLPALLPQVYLHYDPKNRGERDKPILMRQRMDFLILLRHGVRIVIEIDGIQHYADENKVANPKLYANMVAEDRRIKSLGYEVYRFGGAELRNPEEGRQVVLGFFRDLFTKHGLMP